MKPKIINDPVYGFISFSDPLLLRIIDHPWFQRLRRIRQMGMAELVYPGATHTRFHHSLGATHLMDKALDSLKSKKIPFTDEECLGAKLAILLHDVGHGPCSHALEHSIVSGIGHENISRAIMARFNEAFDGQLSTAISIFDHTYPKRYLHQLVSSQLDMDRMDYLNRDSFYTGVSEGIIGYDRILHMLTVAGQELAVDQRAVHSTEKFIIARRLMYWQVYLHKAVLGCEQLLINILRRARELAMEHGRRLWATPALSHFLHQDITAADFAADPIHLDTFCQLDDSDVLSSIKVWQDDEDATLSLLCRMMVRRRLYKVILSRDPLDGAEERMRHAVQTELGIPEDQLHYFVAVGQTSNHTYNRADEHILICGKDGAVRDLSDVDDPLVSQTLALPVVKNYICYPPMHLREALGA